MNQEIAISVKNKIAETDFSEVVSFNSVYRLKFAFDEEWDEYPARVAVLMWAGGAAEKLFTGTECEMPQISSLDADTVLIGVYSRFGEKRIASSFVRLRCEAGAGGFPQPKPTASLHEQVLSFLNGHDWGIFEDRVTEGIYSAVRVNKKGLVTEGKKIIEVRKNGEEEPSDELAPGGVFFCCKDGVYTPYYYDGKSSEELKLVSGNLGHTLTLGDQSFDGTEDVTVELGKLAGKDLVLQGDLAAGSVGTEELRANSVTADQLASESVTENKLKDSAVTSAKLADGAVTGAKLADGAVTAGDHISVAKDGAGNFAVSAKDVVYSVNGKAGDVVIDQDSLGLADVAFSGNYSDLIGVPDTGVYSVNGQTGRVWIDRNTLGLADIAVSGSYHDLVDVPESVTSVNGETGDVVIDQDTLGLADIAFSGNYRDLIGAPDTGVTSVNGQTGKVWIDRNTLGLAEIAVSGSYFDLIDVPEGVSSVNGETGDVKISAEKLGLGALASKDRVMKDDLSAGCVGTEKLADGAVTGAKLAEGAVTAGDHISVAKNGDGNFAVSAKDVVYSVNGKAGDVLINQDTLGLADIAFSGNYSDLVGAPDSGVYSVNGQTGKVWIDKKTLGLADIATSGSYYDLVDVPESGVSSVNGLTGDVMLSADELGLGALASKDLVGKEDLGAGCVGMTAIRAASVTGEKLADGAVKAGRNISVTRDEGNSFVISTDLTTGVTSVNGKTGDVTVDKQSVGLGSLTADRQFPLSFETESAADFNQLLSGAYCVVGTSSHVCSHFPISIDNVSGSDCVWFVFAVSNSDRSRCAQLALSGKSDGAVCVRVLSGGAWTGWKSVNT